MGLEAYRYGNPFCFFLKKNNNNNFLSLFPYILVELLNLTMSNTFLNVLACNVKWLGLRGEDLQLILAESLVPLKPKDLQIAKSLVATDILQVFIYLEGQNLKCFRMVFL